MSTIWQRFAVWVENPGNMSTELLNDQLWGRFGGGAIYILLANGFRQKTPDIELRGWLNRINSNIPIVGWVNAFYGEGDISSQARYHADLALRYQCDAILVDAEDSFAYSQPSGFSPPNYEASDKYVEAQVARFAAAGYTNFIRAISSYPAHTKDIHWGAWRAHTYRYIPQCYFEVDPRFSAQNTFRGLTGYYDKYSTHVAYRNPAIGGPSPIACLEDLKIARQLGFSWGVSIYQGEQMTPDEWRFWQSSGMYRRAV